MRLFFAINFSDGIKNRIAKIQDELRRQSLKGIFPRRENFHLTLAFLGETPEEKLPSLHKILAKIYVPQFDVAFNRTGCFVRRSKEIWWIGAEGGSPGLLQLEEVQGQLSGLLPEALFPVDTRPFRAHITIGREVTHKGRISLAPPDLNIRVDRISLMKSEQIHGVLTYTELYPHQE